MRFLSAVEEAVSGKAGGTSREANTTTSGTAAPRDRCTAFVSNLDYSITADQLSEIFGKVHATCIYNCDYE